MVVVFILSLWALTATVLWLRCDEKRRDLKTDLAQMMHDHDIDACELRRSSEHFDR